MTIPNSRPMSRSASLLVALLLGLTITVGSASAAMIYSNDFETPVGAEWSSTDRTVTPVGGRTFLGEFGPQAVTLTLNGLPSHSNIEVAFDLFVIRTWDGNDILFGPGVYGPDIFQVDVASGPTPLHATFANPFNPVPGDQQSYPDTFPGGSFPAGFGAEEVSSLGYGNDTVYHIELDFLHSGASLSVNFAGVGLQDMADESWGLDNVTVNAIPDGGHSSLWFALLWLAVLYIRSIGRKDVPAS